MDELATTAHLRSASKHPLYLLSMASLVSVGGGWGLVRTPKRNFALSIFFPFNLGAKNFFLSGYFLTLLQ
jgi:hypothetical protein